MMLGSDPTGRLGHPRFDCRHCGTVFTRYPSAARHDPPAYCSMACKRLGFKGTGHPSFKEKVEKSCETCKVAFTVAPSAAGKARFCSQKCMLVWRGPVLSEKRTIPEARTTRACNFCGEHFSTHVCRVKNGRGEFCSRNCSGAWTIRNKQNRVSKAETAFGQALARAGVDVDAQVRVGKWVVDFVLRGTQIAVEFDGEYWHSLPKSVERDQRKDRQLRALGYEVVRIPERLYAVDPLSAVRMVAARMTTERSYGTQTA